MRLALAIGARNLGKTWPNPSVGCVVVDGPRVLGRGVTAPGGRPHGETQALAQAGVAAQGATAYVTLEPCAHHGETPPCTDALIAAGVARVVYALPDPDPRVAGKGHKALEDAGIKVTSGVLAHAAETTHLGFLTRQRLGRPMVTLKLAASFDGRIATASGESRWITGPEARARVHLERLHHDLVLVGAGTARMDDPDLGVRGMGDVAQPVRAVISRRLNLPKDGRLAQVAATDPVWLICDGTPGALKPDDRAFWEGAGATLVGAPAGAGNHVEPGAALTAIAERGITRVFCEGGGSLAASLLHGDLVDQVIGFTAGVMLGAEGQPSLGAMGVDRLAAAPRFELLETEKVGADVMHRWQRKIP
jgi:diaminohydroxyphosphoribosylaminopyrimidine deaminase/5-amino-6-(5-phosphoribosylamino)uracil reductase